MHPRLGPYHVGDIEFSAAFDIDERKVGRDLAEAICQEPNNTVRFAEVRPLGVPVQRGMTHDGLCQYLSQMIRKAPGSTADITNILRETRTHVVGPRLAEDVRDVGGRARRLPDHLRQVLAEA